MPRKPETPFNRIMNAQSKLRMYVQYGDAALGDQTMPDFAAELQECFDHLLTFRNIVNGMVSLDEDPQTAALFYVDTDKIVAAAGQIGND